MVYYSKKEYKLRKNKMYNAVLQNKKTLKSVKVPFSDNKMENFRDESDQIKMGNNGMVQL
jgi:hypothetical protein